MTLVKKNAVGRPSVKKAGGKAIIVTKSTATGSTSFPKKVKAMNILLAKATLISE